MLYYLHHLGLDYEALSFLRLFRYVTFRAGGAALTAFVLALLLGPLTVRLLCRFQAIAPPRLEGLVAEAEVDKRKRKVPSMGGLLILGATLLAMVLWAMPENHLVQIFLGLMTGMGLIGFLDDYLKIVRKNKDGLAARWKFAGQVVLAAGAVWLLARTPEAGGHVRNLMLPLLKNPLIVGMPLALAIAWGAFVVVGASNAVNLSDGMDGLAVGCTAVAAVTYAIFAYLCGHAVFADHLQVPYLPGSSEVVVIASAMTGACLGFLWHNCYPASMFMGDTGSLALGGAIGLIAVLVRQELVLAIVGGIFVVEAGSVILQVSYYKLTRRLYGEPRRIFLCAPFHHHLRMKGWTETQIVIRFWVVAVVLAGVGLATLKIR